MSSNPPRPYRFKSTTLKFQVPGLKTLPRMIQNTEFIRNMSGTETWKTVMNIFHKLRTWSRMTIWGDRVRDESVPSCFTCDKKQKAMLTIPFSALPSIRRPSQHNSAIPRCPRQRHPVRTPGERNRGHASGTDRRIEIERGSECEWQIE